MGVFIVYKMTQNKYTRVFDIVILNIKTTIGKTELSYDAAS